jgi:hypothetical protein
MTAKSSFYWALLRPGYPPGGVGLYELGTGKCLYYTDAKVYGDGDWFYDMSNGKPALYISQRQIYWADGKLAGVGQLPEPDVQDNSASGYDEEWLGNKRKLDDNAT